MMCYIYNLLDIILLVRSIKCWTIHNFKNRNQLGTASLVGCSGKCDALFSIREQVFCRHQSHLYWSFWRIRSLLLSIGRQGHDIRSLHEGEQPQHDDVVGEHHCIGSDLCTAWIRETFYDWYLYVLTLALI